VRTCVHKRCATWLCPKCGQVQTSWSQSNSDTLELQTGHVTWESRFIAHSSLRLRCHPGSPTVLTSREMNSAYISEQIWRRYHGEEVYSFYTKISPFWLSVVQTDPTNSLDSPTRENVSNVEIRFLSGLMVFDLKHSSKNDKVLKLTRNDRREVLFVEWHCDIVFAQYRHVSGRSCHHKCTWSPRSPSHLLEENANANASRSLPLPSLIILAEPGFFVRLARSLLLSRIWKVDCERRGKRSGIASEFRNERCIIQAVGESLSLSLSLSA